MIIDEGVGEVRVRTAVGQLPQLREISRLGALLGRGVRGVAAPASVRGLALETAWSVGHLAIYPLGLARERTRSATERFSLQGLPPVQRGLVIGDVEAAGTPILLVHGLVDNRSIFAFLRRALRRRGFGRVIALNYSLLTDDIRSAARRLAEVVEELCSDTGYERIHVVGHSMGGLLARYYVQRLGGDDRVHTLVTLGTPHAGTGWARVVPHRLFRQLCPGSDVVAELAAPAPGCRTRFVAIWSDLDQLMLPRSAALIEHADLRARNVLVRGVGHMSLPVHGGVVHEICTALAQLDHEGHTVAPGATSISSSSGSTVRSNRPNIGTTTAITKVN
jgi:pimeloyl-ACP methyl ester carboxylesterase